MPGRLNTAQEEKKEGRNQRNEKQKSQVGQALFQPLGPNPSGPEQDLVEVEDPERDRHAA
jgi:hypothetical protein